MALRHPRRACHSGLAACTLPRAGNGEMHAHFRAEAVRLAAADDPAPPSSLTLPGAISQVSYPGGIWRYTVQSGAQRFIIDDQRKHSLGETVRIVLPASALHL